MNLRTIGLVLTATFASVTGLAGCNNAKADGGENAAMAENGSKSNAAEHKVSITVNEQGFSPSSINAKAGEHLMFEFTRVSDQTCAKQVVFPELHLTKDLPLNQTVAVHIPTGSARTLTFQCGMGMFKSSVVIL